MFDQASSKSQHRLKFSRTVTFSPLLGQDAGEYTCSMTVTGFDSVDITENVTVMTNGKQ